MFTLAGMEKFYLTWGIQANGMAGRGKFCKNENLPCKTNYFLVRRLMEKQILCVEKSPVVERSQLGWEMRILSIFNFFYYEAGYTLFMNSDQ